MTGGLGWLTDGHEPLSTFYAGGDSNFERIFGVGYFRKRLAGKAWAVDQVISAPFGDDPVLLSQVTVHNRGPEPAEVHILPTLWFRNIWSWTIGGDRPMLRRAGGTEGYEAIAAADPALGELHLYREGTVPLLFTENETNTQRIFGAPSRLPYAKDGINDYVVHARRDAVNPEQTGTKAAPHYRHTIDPGRQLVVRLRLSDVPPEKLPKPFNGFDATMQLRRDEADEFYRTITPPSLDPDQVFYLRSRGIPESKAKAMLLEAFGGESIDRIENELLIEGLRARLGVWLGSRT